MCSLPLWSKAASGCARSRLLLAVSIVALVPAWLHATPVAPAWWATQGVFISGAATDNYAAINTGQFKAVAAKAAAEFNADFPGGAGSAINNLIATWRAAPGVGVTRDDYLAVNQGQLKVVAKLFYDRLYDLGYTGQPLASGQRYPWTGTGVDNYAMVNIGQLKYVFSFTIDSDGDGMSDVYEIQMGLNPFLADGTAQKDSDGVPNNQDARPNDSVIGRLSITINTPASGAVIN